MANLKRLEYVWLDGYKPNHLRSKVKMVAISSESLTSVEKVPKWSFDGSSTKQAEGKNSDCILEPIRIYKNPIEKGYIVFCEVYYPSGPHHISNQRHFIDTYRMFLGEQYWWGFEQEYFLMSRETKKPLGWPSIGMAEPQGEYYCGVGTKNVQGREIAEQHLEMCLEAGIEITGTNAEVALGQWEYQTFSMDTVKACDDLWMSRYILFRVAEIHNINIELHPKPYEGDWNGSGCHINFSNKRMREEGTEEMMTDICEKLGEQHKAHMEVYGEHNDMRLTGLHETQHISKFSYGVSDRGASIRIPIATVNNEYKGYLEDRRPASNVDPYQATFKIMSTIKEHK